MTRLWDEFAAALFDLVSPQVLLLVSLLVAGLAGALWYWFPAWVPRRMPRLPRLRMPRLRLPAWRWPRWRWPRRRRTRGLVAGPAEKSLAEPAFVPTVVLSDGTLLADRLAAEGRYAEAIRQRLRDVVGDLTAAGVVTPLPGTTAAEVAAAAAVQRPAVAGPLAGATDLFSEIWYGDRPAQPFHDERMRSLTGDVRTRMGPVPS